MGSQVVSDDSMLGAVRLAAEALLSGHLVAFPTETVYGLGADATHASAVARIFEVKGRPSSHPLILHVSSIDELDRWAHGIPEYAHRLASAYSPGPLTLILRKSAATSPLVTGGQETVGIRIPAHPLAQELLLEFASAGGSGALAAPSANRFGRVSPTTAEAVRAELAHRLTPDDHILDGGACVIGLESTIVDCTGDRPSIARPGAISSAMVQHATGLELVAFSHQVRVSGALKSHYAPSAELVIDSQAHPGDGFIALSNHPTPPGVHRLLSPANAEEFAFGLYEALREGDRRGLSRVVAITPDGDGLASAVRDRLSRAASPH